MAKSKYQFGEPRGLELAKCPEALPQAQEYVLGILSTKDYFHLCPRKTRERNTILEREGVSAQYPLLASDRSPGRGAFFSFWVRSYVISNDSDEGRVVLACSPSL